ncbi:M15 family metallopeptidase, partial [Salmonella enterica]|nr:M15 family metallopeptidase [Salmonella enterica]
MLTNLIINIKNVSKNHNKCELFNFNNKQKQTIYYVIFTVGVFFSSSVFADFGVYPISDSECKDMQKSNVISIDNPVPCTRLSKVIFPIIDFDKKTKTGQLIVFDVVAEHTLNIFNEIYSKKIPINKAVKMDEYNGNDDASMADNNTSAFNGRAITGGSTWSTHAYGMAIDVNPLQNPYIGIYDESGNVEVKPPASVKKYINRNELRPGYPSRLGMAETMLDIFYKNGFLVWGGNWDYPIDYQHFQIGSKDFI